eukprot:gene6731-7443_t
MSTPSSSSFVDIHGYIRPSTGKKNNRPPPGGHSSIVFGDEFSPVTSFDSYDAPSGNLRSLSTDSQDSAISWGSPSRVRKAVDRTSIRTVLEQDDHHPSRSLSGESSSRKVRGPVGGPTSILLG